MPLQGKNVFLCSRNPGFALRSNPGLNATAPFGLKCRGVRVQTADGWWLLRASNTQPVLVARCESANEAGLERLKDDLKAALIPIGFGDQVNRDADALAKRMHFTYLARFRFSTISVTNHARRVPAAGHP